MARPRKSVDEQIRALDVQISRLQDKLDALLEKKEGLITRKRQEEIGKLYDFMKVNRISVQDVYHLMGEQLTSQDTHRKQHLPQNEQMEQHLPQNEQHLLQNTHNGDMEQHTA